MPPPMRSVETFGSSVLGDTDNLSILTPETGTIGYEMTANNGGGGGGGGGGASGPPPPPPPRIRPFRPCTTCIY